MHASTHTHNVCVAKQRSNMGDIVVLTTCLRYRRVARTPELENRVAWMNGRIVLVVLKLD